MGVCFGIGAKNNAIVERQMPEGSEFRVQLGAFEI